jgi:hypothetical protein
MQFRSPNFHNGSLPDVAMIATRSLWLPALFLTYVSCWPQPISADLHCGGEACETNDEATWSSDILLDTSLSLFQRAATAVKSKDTSGKIEAKVMPKAEPVVNATADDRKVVWIDSFPRTGSTLVFDIVRNSLLDDSKVFALYEPCHSGDKLSPELEVAGCAGLLAHLGQCNFTGIEKLWGWSKSSIGTEAMPAYSVDFAESACKQAPLVVFKTVYELHTLTPKAMTVLSANPNLYYITVVRDPRAAYASEKRLQATLSGSFSVSDAYTMWEACDTYVANGNLTDPKLINVVYEELVQDPVSIIRGVQEGLGLSMTMKQMQFVRENFDGECEDLDVSDNYATCKTNSTASLETWKQELSNDELMIYVSHTPCRIVCKVYDYDCFYLRPPEPQYTVLETVAVTLSLVGILAVIFQCCSKVHT